MPIQITELNISVSVNRDETESSTAQPLQSSLQDEELQENLVGECIDQVMKIINDKKER